MMRINKYISLSGIASRRAADELVRNGQVQVNGETISDLGHQVDEEKDCVTVNGKVAKLPKKTKVILFHKPAGCVCTKDDPQGRRTVYDYLPPGYQGFKYVGRLDLQSRGLLLFTDDGELLHRLTHPSYEIPRSYYVWTTRKGDAPSMITCRRGMPPSSMWEGSTCRAAGSCCLPTTGNCCTG